MTLQYILCRYSATEARSCDHYCSGNDVLQSLREKERAARGILHAIHIRHVMLSSMARPALHMSFHIIINWASF